MLYGRGLIIGSGVSTNNVCRAVQIGHSANQINCCDPYSSDCRAANTQAIFVALKEEITAAAPVPCLDKCNVNTTLIRNLAERTYWQHYQHCKGCDEFQCPKDAPF